jgi:formylglycine-generating enzyme required for sulfatase activity
MLGNVYEFCADRYAYYEPGPAADPKGPTFGATRVVRSGSFSELPNFARAAARGECGRGWRAGDYGFRLARPQSDGE